MRKNRRKKLSDIPVSVTIESLSSSGQGVSHVDGKVVFIDEALPGERLDFVYSDSRRDYATGKIVAIHSPSPDRVAPPCPHFGVCGGCSWQHIAAGRQIEIKQDLLAEQFERLAKLTIPEMWQPIIGEHWGYRGKARMGVKYVAKKGRVLVGFRERGHHFLAQIDSCRIMQPIVGDNLLALSAMIGGLTIRQKIPQIEVAIGDDICALVFRVLEMPTSTDQAQMRDFANKCNMHICLQPKGPASIVALEGEELLPLHYCLALPDKTTIKYTFTPTMFTQVNSQINQQMINRVLATLDLHSGDRVLDLFCGIGNFTLPLAKFAGNVVGVEGDLPLVAAATENAKNNNISNVQFFAADLSKPLPDENWVRQKYNKIVLDPSRAGACEVLAYVQRWQPDKIIYISCNSATLARDAGLLVGYGYKLRKAGVMDMFPQTSHVESIALFCHD